MKEEVIKDREIIQEILLIIQVLSFNILKQGSDSENVYEVIDVSNCIEKEQIGIWSKFEGDDV